MLKFVEFGSYFHKLVHKIRYIYNQYYENLVNVKFQYNFNIHSFQVLDLSLSPTLSFCNNMIMTSNEFEFHPQLTPKMKIFKHIYIKYLENTYNTTSIDFFFQKTN